MLQRIKSSGPAPAVSSALSRKPTAYCWPSERMGTNLREPQTRQVSRKVTGDLDELMRLKKSFSDAKKSRPQKTVGAWLEQCTPVFFQILKRMGAHICKHGFARGATGGGGVEFRHLHFVAQPGEIRFPALVEIRPFAVARHAAFFFARADDV